ncbi:hypothetical protein C8Q74DRAFT_1367755 [Fomes fomentarius]|nr:hypothetical protein C8Q74DRAFT_1367755 [Fomes fomentarius]
MEDEEDYDELYDDDEIPLNINEFDLGPCINAPSAKLYTTKQLHTMIHEGEIDLNPPYQREVVWSEAKQMKVLDSIWRNYYVPPVVFAVFKDEDGEEVKRCVDGKQRLTSIQKFIDGQIPYKHWKTGKSWWYTTSNAQKKARPEVPKKWKTDFINKTITCVEYRNLSPILERDIFQRVQMGVALTAAEKLQAISSKRTGWIMELQNRFAQYEDSLAQKIDVAVKRGQDFQLLAALVYCCDECADHVQPSSKNLERWLTADKLPAEPFRNTMVDVLTAFWHIADQAELNFPFKNIEKRVAPVEFTFAGVILYVLRDASYEDRAQAIYDMRMHIREKYQDIRNRSDIVKALWEYVDALDEYPKAVSKPKKGKKVKRNEEEDEMDLDEDYRPGKKAKKS